MLADIDEHAELEREHDDVDLAKRQDDLNDTHDLRDEAHVSGQDLTEDTDDKGDRVHCHELLQDQVVAESL